MHISTMAATTVLALTTMAAAPAIEGAAPLPPNCRLVDVKATPQDPTDDVRLCTTSHYVRSGTIPLTNLAGTSLAVAGFSETPPTKPGIGGASLGSSVTAPYMGGAPDHGLEARGFITGAVDRLDLVAYIATPRGATGTHAATVLIEIDSVNFGSIGQVTGAVTPAPGGVAKVTFTFKNLLPTWKARGLSYDPNARHDLRINVSQYQAGDDGAYLFDGTLVPTHVLINKT